MTNCFRSGMMTMMCMRRMCMTRCAEKEARG